MEKKYTGYTAHDLLHDEEFLKAEKEDSGKELWDQQASQDEHFAHEVAVARAIVAGMKKKAQKNRLPEKEEQTLWQQIGESKEKYKQQQKFYHRIYRSIAVAASVVIIVFTLYQFSSLPEEEFDYAAMVMETGNQINNKEQDITLRISDEQELILSGKEATVDYQEGYIEINTGTGDKNKKEEIKDSFNQLIVPKGKRSFVTLADGTQMWVNAGTIVIYPTVFSGNKREIYVEGEIFLDVTPDKEKPFIVKTKEMHIGVLGTQFNVSAYNEDEAHHIILVEGKVEVGLPGKTKQVMKPNEQLTYADNQWNIQPVNDPDHLAWRYGYYQYKDQPLAEVLGNLTKYYGDTILCDPEAENRLCSGKLDLKYDLQEVLRVLADAASLQVDISGDYILLDVKP